MARNYFAIGKQAVFFDDADHFDTVRAWEQATALETPNQKIRVFRELKDQPHLCRRVVGKNREPNVGGAT
jgi:hypothetical protein